MDNKDLVISAVQYDIIWEDKQANFKQLEQKHLPKIADDTDLIILPEMFATGFTMNTENLAEDEKGESLSWLRKISLDYSCGICGSIPFLEGDAVTNRFVFVNNGAVLGYYDKRHLFTYGIEDQHYKAGQKNTILKFKGWKICLQVCYDLRFPVWSRNVHDYDLLLYVASWPDKRIEAWSSLLKARAIENLSYVCGLNRIGKDGSNLNYVGASTIIDYKGEVLIAADHQETIVTSRLKKPEMLNFRDKFGFLNDRDEFRII